jgi:hypothetical protein
MAEATLVDLKEVTGMLQMHRLRRAREDSKLFYAVLPRLNTPSLPENTLLPTQTIHSALVNSMISKYSRFSALRRVNPAKVPFFGAQFLGSFDECTLRGRLRPIG